MMSYQNQEKPIPLPTPTTELEKLRIREYRIRKQKIIEVGEDTGIVITEEKLTGVVDEARICQHVDNCLFAEHILNGGSPCNICKYLVKGDFFIDKRN